MSYYLKSLGAGIGVCFLMACSGAASGGPNADSIAEACGMSTNMGPELCSCVGKKAVSELSPEGVELLDAMLREDKPRADAARAGMDVQETMEAGTFMVRAPNECAKIIAAGG